jgi:hypothetical protein
VNWSEEKLKNKNSPILLPFNPLILSFYSCPATTSSLPHISSWISSCCVCMFKFKWKHKKELNIRSTLTAVFPFSFHVMSMSTWGMWTIVWERNIEITATVSIVLSILKQCSGINWRHVLTHSTSPLHLFLCVKNGSDENTNFKCSIDGWEPESLLRP